VYDAKVSGFIVHVLVATERGDAVEGAHHVLLE